MTTPLFVVLVRICACISNNEPNADKNMFIELSSRNGGRNSARICGNLSRNELEAPLKVLRMRFIRLSCSRRNSSQQTTKLIVRRH